MSDRFLRACLRQDVDATPIWIMRQAGRYLPEYRAVRSKVRDFVELCQTPDLACEVTLQPLARFDLDAAILFSDILVIPEAMGLGLHFEPGKGPYFENSITTYKQIQTLSIPDPQQQLGYVLDTIQLIQHELAGRIPLIGFSGSPWTLACYMLEGGASKNFHAIKRWLFQEPLYLHELLAKLSTAVANYLNAQIAAGVNAVMIFDTWGGILTTKDYEQFSLAYISTIIKNLNPGPKQQRIPVIVFTKGAGLWLEQIAECGCDVVGIDWTLDLDHARKRIGDQVALQGNMDPAALLAKPERIREEVAMLLAQYGTGAGHIFNLGHGITPEIDPEHVAVLVDAVHDLSKLYHPIAQSKC